MKPGNFQVKLIAVAFAATAAIALLVPSAGASPASVQNVQPLSAGVLPICDAPLDPEVDTRIAVNPTDPDNIVASWFQAGAGVTVVAASHDGGATWTSVVVPGHSTCSGGAPDNAFAYDPALAFDREGALYVGSLIDAARHERVVVSRSLDGGLTWGEAELVDEYAVPIDNDIAPDPADLGHPQLRNHELWLTADPKIAGRVYAVWKKHDIRLHPDGNRYWPAYISRRDAGADGRGSWSPPRTLLDPDRMILTWGHTPRPLPSGRLLDVYWKCDAHRPCGTQGAIAAIRSDQAVSTWSSKPVVIADVTDACGRQPRDHEAGAEVFTQPKPAFDVAPNGAAYAVWHAIRCLDGRSRLMFSTSRDGGLSWTQPRAIKDDTAQAFSPTLAVGPSGVIGVTYYDFRDDVEGDDELTTHVWFVHSHDGGVSWEEVHLAGPFDLRKSGHFLADYYGLAAFPGGFAASFLQALPEALDPPTDVFFARVSVEGARATGGGWLANRDGGKLNFAFRVREAARGFEGDVRLNADGSAPARIVVSEVTFVGAAGEDCGALAGASGSLELLGRGTHNGRVAGFRVCVQDNGEGAGAQGDRFSLACTDGCAYTTGDTAPDDAIDGGNIQVSGSDARTGSQACTVILDPFFGGEASMAGTLTASVYGPDQEPRANASVTLTATTNGVSGEAAGAVTDTQGLAAFPGSALVVDAEYTASACGIGSNAVELSAVVD